jgi:hypothetical protein
MLRKADVLADAGYLFDYVNGTYVNKSRKVVVSLKFTDDVSAEELEARLAAAPRSAEWQFLFLESPSPRVRQELIAEYGGGEHAYG